MNIFISYPRELKEKARIIASEVNALEDDVFIDEDSIDYTEEWKKKINEGLKRSNIFIILYNLDEISSQDPSRYINTEIKLIEKEIKRKPKKKAIVVVFPPSKTKTIPPFFRRFNIINYNEGDIADYDWTNKVIESIENVKKKEKLLKWIKIISPILLISSSIVYLYNIGKIFPKPTPSEKDIITEPVKPELCSLSGSVPNQTYSMANSYIYINETFEGVKFLGISKEGSWNSVQCIEREGKFFLEGEEQTTHDIFFSENDQPLSYFGSSTNNTKSSISFSSKGFPDIRIFTKPTNYNVTAKCDNPMCDKEPEKKKYLEEKYINLVKKKHKNQENQGNEICKPLIAKGSDFNKDDRSIYIVSICKNYTRVMLGTLAN